MYNRVTKRDGKIVDFDITKISDAMRKAFEATDTEYNESVIDFLALKVTADFQPKISNGQIAVEDIQDSVETVLSMAGYEQVAKAYILYRMQREKLRNTKSVYLDYKDTIEKYLNTGAWPVKENGALPYSVGGLVLSNSGAITANYWLSEVYDEEVAGAHRNCELHIHDLSMLTPYYAGWSLDKLIRSGLGIPGKTCSKPASHLSTLCNQIVNFIGVLQNEWAGAQTLPSFDTYLAPYIKADNLSEKQVKQCIQSFVFGINIPSRWGSSSPFLNVILDGNAPEDLKNTPAIVGGREMSFTYGDCREEMKILNRVLFQIMLEGDANGHEFLRPVLTCSITSDFDWTDSENNQLLFTMAKDHAAPYFLNYVHSGQKPSEVRATKNKEKSDFTTLKSSGYGPYGCGEDTGSVGAVTINLPRIAYLSKDEEDFMRRLRKLTDLACRALHQKRIVLEKFLENGLYPYTKYYLGTFENCVSTVGLVGMNEACLNAAWIRKDLTDRDAKEFADRVLKIMRENLLKAQREYLELYDLSATPSEATAYRFAKHDKDTYSEIITALDEKENLCYTNSSQFPADKEEELSSYLATQELLQGKYTSGTVLLFPKQEDRPDWKDYKGFSRSLAEIYRVPCFKFGEKDTGMETSDYMPGEQFVDLSGEEGKDNVSYIHRVK